MRATQKFGTNPSLKGKLCTCTGMTHFSKGASLFGKVPSLASCFNNFLPSMSVHYMLNIAVVFFFWGLICNVCIGMYICICRYI